jgi:Clp amino terminal domain, pathogenicity island component
MHRDRLDAVDELATLVESRVHEPLPASRLQAAIELSRELADASDALVERFVGEARAAGLSWTEIGQAFGTSKQAVAKRYGLAADDAGQWPGRWTAAARDALTRAGDEARALGHDFIGTEHVLLALVSAPHGVAAEGLRALGIERAAVLSTSCMQHDSGQARSECLPVMPRLKQALELSIRIADGLDVRLADTEHLLAGVVAVPDSMAVEILRRLGVSAGAVRAVLAERLDVPPERLRGPRRRRRRLGLAAR